jgi:hypothetical protein
MVLPYFPSIRTMGIEGHTQLRYFSFVSNYGQRGASSVTIDTSLVGVTMGTEGFKINLRALAFSAEDALFDALVEREAPEAGIKA